MASLQSVTINFIREVVDNSYAGTQILDSIDKAYGLSVLGAVMLDGNEKTIPHFLGREPRGVFLSATETPMAPGYKMGESKPADATNVYINGTSGVAVQILVF